MNRRRDWWESRSRATRFVKRGQSMSQARCITISIFIFKTKFLLFRGPIFINSCQAIKTLHTRVDNRSYDLLQKEGSLNVLHWFFLTSLHLWYRVPQRAHVSYTIIRNRCVCPNRTRASQKLWTCCRWSDKGWFWLYGQIDISIENLTSCVIAKTTVYVWSDKMLSF